MIEFPETLGKIGCPGRIGNWANNFVRSGRRLDRPELEMKESTSHKRMMKNMERHLNRTRKLNRLAAKPAPVTALRLVPFRAVTASSIAKIKTGCANKKLKPTRNCYAVTVGLP